MEELYKIKLLDESIDFKASKVIPVFLTKYQIGRGEECNLQYDKSWISVSRLHAIIISENEKRWIEIPKESSNDLFVNKKKIIEKKRKLKNKDTIQFSNNGPRIQILFKPSYDLNLWLIVSYAILGVSILLALYTTFFR